MQVQCMSTFIKMATNVESPFQHVGSSFEKNFIARSSQEVFKTYWTYSIYIGLIYLVVVFGLVRFMKDRPALILNRTMTLYWLILAVINGYSTYRLWQDYFLYRALRLAGSLVCQDYSCNTNVHGLAMVVYCFGKTLALAETVFLVLRTHKAPFVQWYHHVTVFVFTWYCAANSDSFGRYGTILDCTVHTILCGYRFLKCTRFRLIRNLPRASLILYIFGLPELVLIFVANYLAYHYDSGGEFAGKSETIQQLLMVLCSSYIVAHFAHMFS